MLSAETLVGRGAEILIEKSSGYKPLLRLATRAGRARRARAGLEEQAGLKQGSRIQPGEQVALVARSSS